MERKEWFNLKVFDIKQRLLNVKVKKGGIVRKENRKLSTYCVNITLAKNSLDDYDDIAWS